MTTLQIVFVALPACLILIWLILAARGPRQIDVPNAIAVLRYGGGLRTLTLAMALLTPMIWIYVIAVFPWFNNMRLWYAGGLELVMCLLAGFTFVEVSRGVVCLTEEGIIRNGPWTRRVTLNWTEVEQVRYAPLNSVFVVTGAGRKIRVSRYFVGVKVFADTVKRKLATERFRTAMRSLDAIR